MDIYADLEDDLVESEFVKQEVKYKSLGIEPLALVILPEGRTRKSNRDTTTTLPWNAQYDRTSYLLTSASEMNKDPFLVKNKSAKQLELQENDVANASHEAAFLKNNPENTVYILPSLTVELGEDSNLLMTPNERQEIPFEVTNNLNSATRVTFTVRDELGILLEIDRYIAILRPHASTTVRVAVLPKSGQHSDRITFIATGSEQVRKDVLVDIGGNYQSDTDAPFVDYTYTSDCTDIVLSKCKEGTWTIKITAQDSDSGIKLLTTIPKGLYFPDTYTSGTREEVTGIYSESCCNADLQIIAVDRMNNRYSRQINAYRAPLSFWAVTAITSVSLIFLAIIIVSSLICLKKCKRNEADSFDLPTYRGGRSRY
ncbi:uncharacterized protein LOC123685947 [Harmonia axyridis]|uniref:uncharacterized protein LOC123685947 n=1 Tax=Harmonia axyridis TaxID=115357 RepID=UPI001E277D60|nr:uncharacterized protein LOC123685947 [Harmonia axyridis]